MVVLNGWAQKNCRDPSLRTDKHLYESFSVHRHLMLEYFGYKVMVHHGTLILLWIGYINKVVFYPHIFATPTWGDCACDITIRTCYICQLSWNHHLDKVSLVRFGNRFMHFSIFKPKEPVWVVGLKSWSYTAMDFLSRVVNGVFLWSSL